MFPHGVEISTMVRDLSTAEDIEFAGTPEESVSLREVFLVLGILLVCMIPLLIKLDVPDCRFHMEVMSLMPSQETWLRYHSGESAAWIVPSLNGRPRINKPPLLVWLNFLAWLDLDPEHDSVQVLIFRARLLAVCLICLALFSTYVMGRMLGGVGLAWKAALATGTMLLFIRQSRLASYDTHLLAWVTMTVASGWWAMRLWQRDHHLGASMIAVLITGVALGAAILSKGPIALLFSLIPLVVIAYCFQPSWRYTVTILVLIMVAASIVTLPWYAHIFENFHQAGSVLYTEYRATRSHFQPPWYYLGLLGLVFPWTMSLTGALTFPLFRKQMTFQREWWIPLLWCLLIVCIMSIPGAKRERYIVPVLPAAGLLIAQWWQVMGNIQRANLMPHWLRSLLMNAHGLMLILCSFACAVFPIIQSFLLQKGILGEPEVPGAGWKTGIVFGTIMIGLSVECFRLLRRSRMEGAFCLTALWMIMISTGILNYYVHSYHGHYGGRAYAEETARLSKNASLVYLCVDPTTDLEPDEKFLLYSRRIIPRIIPENVAERRKEVKNLAVIARAQAQHEYIMAEHGMRAVLAFNDGRQDRMLYLDQRSFKEAE